MSGKYIPVKTKKETSRVYLDEIIYVEKNLRKTILITDSRTVVLYCDMAYIKQFIDERFMDCHRSFLFNMDKIIIMTNQTVYMEKGHQVGLGRESFRRGRRIFDRYLEQEKR
ncbi:LytTR family transcriptional regulator [Anaerovorax odorimutans]|uniref:LytTR family transcriptional regulator n=1 Tax=Anaerovorax odorimutans TaxID=109327 RepID=A0ABT1RRR0_9FIRM|nr:LytTR family DNA-binding domain-containing protein [Anaerovorax odorimutans]MCQ4637890.1 LytTR family transcriptional regulator [Anaerovorax odorimutans]